MPGLNEVQLTYITKEGKPDFVAPRAVQISELPAILEEYRIAAINAKRAGFDGVEVHSANAYFLDQWLRDSTNLRTDEYGGSIENRMRFPLAAIRATIEGFGDASKVGVRIALLDILTGRTPLELRPGDSSREGALQRIRPGLGKCPHGSV